MKTVARDSVFAIRSAVKTNLLFRVLFLADSIQIRFLMCATSFGWGLSYLLDAEAFITRPYYAEMVKLGPPWLWGVSFMAHALGAMWRIWESKPRPAWAFAINGWGAFVWGMNCYAQIWGAGHWVPSATADVGCFFMLLCAWASTDWNRSTQTT